MRLMAVQANFVRAAALLRCAPPFWRDPARSLNILYYHNFTAAPSPSFLDVQCATVALHFERLRRRFTLLPAREALDALFHNGRLPCAKPAVVLSIDDAFRSIAGVLPWFEKFEVPVVVFVPAGLSLGDTEDGLRSWCLHYFGCIEPAGRPADLPAPEKFFDVVMAAHAPELRYWKDRLGRLPRKPEPVSVEPLFSAAELRGLGRHPLITLAPHSMSHVELSTLPERWCRWEIETSRRYLAQWGGDSELFAYPYGTRRSFNQRTTTLMQEAGVRYVLTTDAKPVFAHSSPYRIGRTGLYDYRDAPYVRGAAGGALEWWGRLRDSALGRALAPPA